MAQSPTGVMVVAPSTVTVGEKFSIGLKILREPYTVGTAVSRGYPALKSPFNLSPRGINYMDNAAERWEGTLQVTSDGLDGPGAVDIQRLPGAFRGDERAIGRVEGYSFTSAGTHTIEVSIPELNISAVSNPVEVTSDEPEMHLYWGDLHSQTYFSDGLRCPEELYSFARDEAFLDIFALADHSDALVGGIWDYMVGTTNLFNDPGRFVTLVGFEWTASDIGHRNVYYPGDDGPVISHTRPDGDTLPKLFELARNEGALLIPHHTSNVTMGVKWDLGHEPTHERLVEIYSVWGNSERPAEQGNPRPIRTLGGEQPGQHVIDALNDGRKMGFVAGGDIHDGRPGDELHNLQTQPEQYHLLHRQGIMGVWMPRLTRGALWEALWNRRCYATTNNRTILRFSVDDAFMGQSILNNGPRTIRIEAKAEVPISRVDIVKNGRDWQTVKPDSPAVEVEETDAEEDSDYYYIRVIRADGEMAWSSPVWVNM